MKARLSRIKTRKKFKRRDPDGKLAQEAFDRAQSHHKNTFGNIKPSSRPAKRAALPETHRKSSFRQKGHTSEQQPKKVTLIDAEIRSGSASIKGADDGEDVSLIASDAEPSSSRAVRNKRRRQFTAVVLCFARRAQTSELLLMRMQTRENHQR
jgi:hypothetical protein